jgi:hypothetical protein
MDHRTVESVEGYEYTMHRTGNAHQSHSYSCWECVPHTDVKTDDYSQEWCRDVGLTIAVLARHRAHELLHSKVCLQDWWFDVELVAVASVRLYHRAHGFPYRYADC